MLCSYRLIRFHPQPDIGGTGAEQGHILDVTFPDVTPTGADAMRNKPSISLEVSVFSLVAATFATIYITQPVLPVIQNEFGVNETTASLTISMVVLGIALSNLPFGRLADRLPIRPIIITGGSMVTASPPLMVAIS